MSPVARSSRALASLALISCGGGDAGPKVAVPIVAVETPGAARALATAPDDTLVVLGVSSGPDDFVLSGFASDNPTPRWTLRLASSGWNSSTDMTFVGGPDGSALIFSDTGLEARVKADGTQSFSRVDDSWYGHLAAFRDDGAAILIGQAASPPALLARVLDASGAELDEKNLGVELGLTGLVTGLKSIGGGHLAVLAESGSAMKLLIVDQELAPISSFLVDAACRTLVGGDAAGVYVACGYPYEAEPVWMYGASGRLRWKRGADSFYGGTLGPDGLVYLGRPAETGMMSLEGLDADGNVAWRLPVGNNVYALDLKVLPSGRIALVGKIDEGPYGLYVFERTKASPMRRQ